MPGGVVFSVWNATGCSLMHIQWHVEKQAGATEGSGLLVIGRGRRQYKKSPARPGRKVLKRHHYINLSPNEWLSAAGVASWSYPYSDTTF